MDSKLSEFTTRTCCDPGLALDLLKSHEWRLKDALSAFYMMKGIISYEDHNPKGLLVSEGIENEIDVPSQISIRLKTVSCGSLPSLPSPSSPPPDPLGSTTSSTNSSPSKLALSKTDIRQDDLLNEIYPSKKLSRGISRATDNVNLVSRARNEFAQEFGASTKRSQIEVEESLSKETYSTLYIKAPETFTLPDLSIHPPDFSEFLEKDLIEKSSLISLQAAGRLNWWADDGICQRLWPLATSGDGNCLLHAASLGMWGFHDRLLTLRKALHAILSNSSYTNSFYRRWRWQSSIQNKAAGLILCEEEWEKDWATLLKMASTEPRNLRTSQASSTESKKNGLTGGKKSEPLPEEELQPHVYESLEELHIMALAHVLHRPIIVVADTMLKDVTGEPFAPIPFGGIYLPLECNQGDCHRSPLCLTYDAAHFSALVAMDKETYADDTPRSPAAIPLVDSECNLLPLQFSIDPGPDVAWGKDENDDQFIQSKTPTFEQKIALLSKYLDILYINKPTSTSSNSNTNSKSSSSSQSDPAVGKSSCSNGDSNTYSTKKTNSSPEKYATLPAKMEMESKTSTLVGSISAQSEQLPGEKKSFKFFKHFHFISIRKRFGKKFRKNVTSFARSASLRFRRNSNSKVSTCNSSNGNTKVNNEHNNSCAKGASDVTAGGKTTNSTSTSNGTSKCNTNKSTTTTVTCAQKENQFICAVLHAEKKPDHREQMIRNYLCSARFRFEQLQKDKELKSSSTPRSSTASSTPSDSSSLSTAQQPANSNSNCNSNSNSNSNYASQCVNSGCSNFGTATTSYLCSKCFQDQKEEMSKCEKEFGEKNNILNNESNEKSNIDDSKKTVTTKCFNEDDADGVDAGAAKKKSAHSLEMNPSDNLTTGVSIRC